jgi:hypothetical protein
MLSGLRSDIWVNESAALALSGGRNRYSTAMRPPALIACILAALVAVVLLTRFLWAFSDWNKEQACATGGGRNCAHYEDDDR